MCNYVRTCCDTNVNQNEDISSPIKEIIKHDKKISILPEPKPNSPLIKSVNVYEDFCGILSSVLKIQRRYRKFKQKKNEERSRSTDKSANITSNNALTKSSTKKKNEYSDEERKDKEVNKESHLIEKILSSPKAITLPNQELSDKLNQSSFFSGFTQSSHSPQYTVVHNSTQTSSDPNKKEIFGYFYKKARKNLKYKGNFDTASKKKNGFGIVTWEDGSKLKSKFSMNHCQGYSQFINKLTNGIFSGYYDNNIPRGYGKFKSANGSILEGIWEKNRLDGIGIELWEDDTYYQGELKGGMKNGIGLYRWPDGTIYEGEWINNKISGYGIITFNDEKVYRGQIENGLMHGFGEFSWPNGNKYIGDYVTDKKEGFGMFMWKKEPLLAYIGFWTDGKQHGCGIRINGKEVRYGLWKEGRKDIWLQGSWEMEKYLKGNQLKIGHFISKDIDYILKSFQIDTM